MHTCGDKLNFLSFRAGSSIHNTTFKGSAVDDGEVESVETASVKKVGLKRCDVF
ncbi:MAG: hypothetical protein ACI8WM_002361 [Burkholderiaceae bacterium]|jgi:hypothetical protein